MSNVYTYTTEIKKREYNKLLMNYITEYKGLFNKIQRVAFYKIKNNYVKNKKFTLKDKGELVKYIARKYHITTRAASSIVYNMAGRFNAIKELKEYEKNNLELKIESLGKKIANIEENRQKLNSKVSINIATKEEEKRYKKIKIILYWKRNKLNKMKQKILTLDKEINDYKYKICFGRKKLLQRDYGKFLEQRDSEIFYVGRADEKACNMNFQVKYNKKDNQFYLQIRKEIDTKQDRYARGKVYFNQRRTAEIKELLRSKKSPLTYRIKVKNGKYYLQIIFQYKHNKSMCLTRNSNGVVGVDFNKGFVAVTETDKYGNLKNIFNIKYRFRSGNKTESDFQYIAKKLSEYCLENGKDLVIENLNFKKTKGKMVIKGGFKPYNEMLSNLAYAKFSKIIESKCAKKRIFLSKVNPAWTSYIAKEKYCEIKKLNVHSGASYVIARRGQGLKDKIK